jgi:hypothetical protein
LTDSFANIIAQLEHQKTAIEKALAALRDISDSAPATPAPVKTATTREAPVKRKKFSAAARKRMALAQKARYAKLKGESEPPTPVTAEAPKVKRKISPEGLKRIIAATKKRWRLKRAEAAAQAQTPAVKKAAVKKAVKKTATKKAAPAPILQAAG